NLAGTGSEGLELTASAFKSVGQTLLGLSKDGSEAAVATLEKLSGGLGAVASAINASDDFQALIHGGNYGDGLKLIGDTLSTVGAALGATGVGLAAAVPLEVIGTLASLAGGLISGHIHEEQWNAEEKQLLGKIGLGDSA